MELGRSAAAAYERDGTLCPSATHPVPQDLRAVRGTKYPSTPADWSADGRKAGFACLRFSMPSPQYFQYSYASVSGSSFTVQAHGDLDGDGVPSTFQLTGEVEGNKVVLTPSIMETNPTE